MKERIGIDSELRRLIRGPLIVDSALKEATPIDRELTPDELETLHLLGVEITSPNTAWLGIAYTQIPEQILDKLEIAGLRNIIYFSNQADDGTSSNQFESFRGYILINPEVVEDRDSDCWYNYEGCGSIAEGKIGMWVQRPRKIHLRAGIWKPGMSKVEFIDRDFEDTAAALLLHEWIHLRGKAATHEPWSFRLLNVLTRYYTESDPEDQEILRTHQYLVFDGDNRRFVIAWGDGRVIGEYPAPDPSSLE